MSLETLAPPITTADELVDHIALRLSQLPEDTPHYTQTTPWQVGRHTLWLMDDTVRPLVLPDGTETTYGSFKHRGAEGRLRAVLAEDPDMNEAHAPTAGNAGLCVAGVMLEHNRARPDRDPISTHIHAPHYLSSAKEADLIQLGAIIHKYQDLPAAIDGATLASQHEHGALFLPFNDPDVIAGQASLAFEIAKLINTKQLAECGGVGVAFQIGGGGLSAGNAAALHLFKEMGILPSSVTTHVGELEDKEQQLWSAGTATATGDQPNLILQDRQIAPHHYRFSAQRGKAAVVASSKALNKLVEGAGAGAVAVAFEMIHQGVAPQNIVVPITGSKITQEEFNKIAAGVNVAPQLPSTRVISDLRRHRAPV